MKSAFSPFLSQPRPLLQFYFRRTRRASHHHHHPWIAFKSTTASDRPTSSCNVKPAPFEYEYIEEVERLERYRAGGNHPLVIGDVIKDRYQVVHKLGFGTFSTTWLCRDNRSNRYAAVKVGTGDSNPREAEILELLNSASPSLNHPGRSMIPTVQDRFLLRGPNGTHPCYVTAPAMCSISGAKDASYNRLFQASTARSLIAQLVLAVAYTHARGVVHGGWSVYSWSR
jgi:hypothetical protein